MLHTHIPFGTYAAVGGAVLALIAASLLAGPVRRHLARLAESLVIGAAVAFGVTAWADGQRHKALAAAAARPGAHPTGVTASLAAAFTVLTVITAAVAVTVLALAARRRRGRVQRMLAAGGPLRPVPRGRTRAW